MDGPRPLEDHAVEVTVHTRYIYSRGENASSKWTCKRVFSIEYAHSFERLSEGVTACEVETRILLEEDVDG